MTVGASVFNVPVVRSGSRCPAIQSLAFGFGGTLGSALLFCRVLIPVCEAGRQDATRINLLFHTPALVHAQDPHRPIQQVLLPLLLLGLQVEWLLILRDVLPRDLLVLLLSHSLRCPLLCRPKRLVRGLGV